MGHNSGAEKRRHERVIVQFPMFVKDGDRGVGTIEDISKGGMRVKLSPDSELGEDTEVRDWTGKSGTENREYILNQLIGEVFNLSIIYMSVTIGHINTKLVRVIRNLNQIYLWGIHLITVTPSAKDELGRRYPKKLALYGEDWKARQTVAPHFWV